MVTLAGGACRNGPDAVPPATVRDSAGIRIVENTGVDRPAPWRLEPIATIGGADTGASNLGRLDYSTVGADTLGHIYVVSESEAHVAVFDSLGRFLRTLGRKGGGPGEFKVVGSMYVDPSGLVSIQDYGKIRLVRFSLDGKNEPEMSLAPVRGRLYGVIRFVGDILVLHGGQFTGPGPPPEMLLAITATDTTTLQSFVPALPNGILNACNRYRMPGMARVFAPAMNWTTGAGVVAANSTAGYEVDVYRPNRLVQQIRRSVALPPATGKMIKRLYPAGRMYGGKECTVPAEQIEREIGAAGVVPAIHGVAVDQDGRLWIERFTFPDEASRTDVVASNGEYLGTVPGITVPLGFPSRDLVVTAAVDSVTDVGRLVVHRLIRRE